MEEAARSERRRRFIVGWEDERERNTVIEGPIDLLILSVTIPSNRVYQTLKQ